MNTDSENMIHRAVKAAGGSAAVAEACGLKSYQAVNKWIKQGRFPRTEWTGETDYSGILERMTNGRFTKRQLLNGCTSVSRGGAAAA